MAELQQAPRSKAAGNVTYSHACTRIISSRNHGISRYLMSCLVFPFPWFPPPARPTSSRGPQAEISSEITMLLRPSTHTVPGILQEGIPDFCECFEKTTRKTLNEADMVLALKLSTP